MNILNDLLLATQSAALAAFPYVGRNDKIKADDAAVRAIRAQLNTSHARFVVAIGEGEKDHAPMLHNGEVLGSKDSSSRMFQIATDPIDGTTLVAKGAKGAVSVIAGCPEGGLCVPSKEFYMYKIAAPSRAKGAVSIFNTVSTNIKNLADALNKDIGDVTVAVLDRPRHAGIVQEVKDAGAKVELIPDGDVLACVRVFLAEEIRQGKIPQCSTQHPPIDLYLGVGGAPEGVISACAAASTSAVFEGMYCSEKSVREANLHGDNPKWGTFGTHCAGGGVHLPQADAMSVGDLVKSTDVYFVTTGITDGVLLRGVEAVPPQTLGFQTQTPALHSNAALDTANQHTLHSLTLSRKVHVLAEGEKCTTTCANYFTTCVSHTK